jgi:hypothetical protein
MTRLGSLFAVSHLDEKLVVERESNVCVTMKATYAEEQEPEQEAHSCLGPLPIFLQQSLRSGKQEKQLAHLVFTT